MPYTVPDRAEKVAAVLAGMHTGKSLRKACIAAEVAPGSFMEWVKADAGLAEQYSRAREAALDAQADELLDIADEPVGVTDNGGTDSGAVADKKLRIHTRQWLMAKMAPKRYGDRVEVAGDPDSPLAVSLIRRVIVDPKT